MHVQRDYIVICGGVNGSMVFTYRGSLVLKRLCLNSSMFYWLMLRAITM